MVPSLGRIAMKWNLGMDVVASPDLMVQPKHPDYPDAIPA
jgi:hypothetical protein